MTYSPNNNNKEEADIPAGAPTNSSKPLKEEDVIKLMYFARCDRDEASRALYNNNHDVFTALRSMLNKADPGNQTPDGKIPSKPNPIGTPLRSFASPRETHSISTSTMPIGMPKSIDRGGGARVKTGHQPGQIDSESEYSAKSDDESISSSRPVTSGGIKYDGRGRRSEKKAPAKSAQKKTPAKTPNSRKKLVKDMSYEEKRAHRRPIEAKSKRKSRERTRALLASPALRMQASVENFTEATTRICDHLGDAQKNLFCLTEGLQAAIE